MRTGRLWVVIVSLLCLAAGPALALHENELWRSELGRPKGVAVSPVDGTVWAAIGSRVYHFGTDNSVLDKIELREPIYLSPISPDGGFWVLEKGVTSYVTPQEFTLLRFSADGDQLAAVTGNSIGVLAANPADGSCWYERADSRVVRIVHLAADGTELLRRDYHDLVGETLPDHRAWAVDASDGSLWGIRTEGYTDYALLLHLSQEGGVIWRGGDAALAAGHTAIAVNPTDHSVWLTSSVWDVLVHVSSEGVELWRGYLSLDLVRVWVSPSDASLWVQTLALGLIHLSPDGQTILWSEREPTDPYDPSFAARVALSFDPTDGSCWVTPTQGGGPVAPAERTSASLALRHFAPDGTVLGESEESFNRVCTLGVNPADGSVWVPGFGQDPLVRVSSDGDILARTAPGSHLYGPTFVVSDPTDGSVLVRDAGFPSDSFHGSALVRYASDGSEIWRSASLESIVGDAAVTWAAYGALLPGSPQLFESGASVDGDDGSFWAIHPRADNVALRDSNITSSVGRCE